MLKVSLTHDVDRTEKTYQYLTHTLKALRKGDMRTASYHLGSLNRRKQVYWNFEDIMEIEDRFDARSTFYFLLESFPFSLLKPKSWKLALGRYDIHEERITELIHQLIAGGWEIGLHGSWASYNSPELLKKEKQMLEDVAGQQVKGIRQHYLNWNEDTWQLQKQAGFLYDTTWGYTRKIGYRENKVKPFAPFNDHFKVFPMAIMDSCYMNTPDRLRELYKLIQLTRDNDAVLVINWHSNNYNEKDFPGYREAYIEIIEACKAEGARFGTLEEFYEEMMEERKGDKALRR